MGKLWFLDNKYITYQLSVAMLFTVVYWIVDKFINNNKILSKNLGLIEHDYKFDETDQPNTLLYYVWFSLITQTTVGYGSPTALNGKSYESNVIQHRTFKIINTLQLISIFVINSLFI